MEQPRFTRADFTGIIPPTEATTHACHDCFRYRILGDSSSCSCRVADPFQDDCSCDFATVRHGGGIVGWRLRPHDLNTEGSTELNRVGCPVCLRLMRSTTWHLVVKTPAVRAPEPRDPVCVLAKDPEAWRRAASPGSAAAMSAAVEEQQERGQ